MTTAHDILSDMYLPGVRAELENSTRLLNVIEGRPANYVRKPVTRRKRLLQSWRLRTWHLRETWAFWRGNEDW